ncbi:MAG: hypothetical protein AAGB93_06340 [Planctomycetota bacterium]
MGASTASDSGERARFRRGLIGLAALGVVSQALIQTEAFGGNPMVLVPQVDAAVVWDRAGEIAAGDLVGDRPFESAPLLLWITALVRVCDGGLAALGALQSILLVATALLVARVARTLAQVVEGGASAGRGSIGPGAVGLFAGALFLLLEEPAAGTSRVLAGTLQLFVTSLLLDRLLAFDAAPSSSRAALAGAAAGLSALAFPPFVGLLPLLAVWAYLVAGRAVGAAAALVGAGVLAIAPATLHNLAACGEPITISSQAGLTFFHGNNPLANGTFVADGVVNSKEEQALDSLQQARTALGDPDAGWRAASRYWFGRGLEWWADEPVHATGVAAVKSWYALSGRHYGDVYQPWLERRDGVARRLWLAPVPLAWILPVALVALFGLVRTVGLRAATPWLLVVLVPLAVCVVFWYTPRYRLPATAALVPLAAVAVGRMFGGGRASVTLGVAVVLGLGTGPLNHAIGFDEDPLHERRHAARMAKAFGTLELHDDGLRYLRRDVELAPDDAEAQGRVVQLLLFLGRDVEAIEAIHGAPEAVRSLAGPRALLAWTLATSADAEARDGVEALALAEDLVSELGRAPELLDTRAAARARTGDFDGAADDARAALTALTADDPLRKEVEDRLVLFEAGRPYTQVPRR